MNEAFSEGKFMSFEAVEGILYGLLGQREEIPSWLTDHYRAWQRRGSNEPSHHVSHKVASIAEAWQSKSD